MRIQYLNARPLINCLVNLFANVTFSSHVARGQESRIYMNLPINSSIKHGWDNAGTSSNGGFTEKNRTKLLPEGKSYEYPRKPPFIPLRAH